MRSVAIMTEVEVDIDNYIDEVLEECEDQELIAEVEKRGHKVYEKGVLNIPFGTQYLEFKSPDDFKRYLCDITGLGYYTSNETLLNEIKSKLP